MPLFNLFPLPIGLDNAFVTWLAAFAAQLAPRDAYEEFLVGRITQAMARLRLSAEREPLEPNSLWLRYEAAADRLYHRSLGALQKYRKNNPLEMPTDPEPTPEPADPTTAPNTAKSPTSIDHVWPTAALAMSDTDFEAFVNGPLAALARAHAQGDNDALSSQMPLQSASASPVGAPFDR